MSKAERCLLHLACIAVKLTRGQPVRWHWDHILGEFNIQIDSPHAVKPIEGNVKTEEPYVISQR